MLHYKHPVLPQVGYELMRSSDNTSTTKHSWLQWVQIILIIISDSQQGPLR